MTGEVAVQEEFRSLARVVAIDDVIRHPNADRLDIAIIGGWQCVIGRDTMEKGDKGLFFEIDSLLPLDRLLFAPLAEKDSKNIKVIGEQSYYRVKTMKLRKELSQGYLIPLPGMFSHYDVDANLTTELGVLKYESKDPGTVSTKSNVRDPKDWFGRFCDWVIGGEIPNGLLPWPRFLSKSEERRVQNVGHLYNQAVENKELFERSFKLDGESMTIYCCPTDKPGDYVTGVCSRNCEISQEDITFTYWEATCRFIGQTLLATRRAFRLFKHGLHVLFDNDAQLTGETFGERLKVFLTNEYFHWPKFITLIRADDNPMLKYVLENRHMEKLGEIFYRDCDCQGKFSGAFAVQGEFCGPGIQNNFEKLMTKNFFVYRVYTSENSLLPLDEPLLPEAARAFCEENGFQYIPVDVHMTLPETVKDCLAQADGPGAFGTKVREGHVYKSLTRDFSFKAISNKYLLNDD